MARGALFIFFQMFNQELQIFTNFSLWKYLIAWSGDVAQAYISRLEITSSLMERAVHATYGVPWGTSALAHAVGHTLYAPNKERNILCMLKTHPLGSHISRF